MKHRLNRKVFLSGCLVVIVAQLFIATRCSKDDDVAPEEGDPCMFLGVDTCKQAEKGKLVVNLSETKQTMHSFGGSDCWTTKFIGNWADVDKKNEIADLLFSTDTLDNGTPVGIGLSMWRFNIGAGSFEQGEQSNITTDWRREECFQSADGSYDWSRQSGQQWFLEAAKERGVLYTLGFSLSAPVHMTKNGKAFNGTADTKLNILDGKLDEYADFMVDVSQHFQFDYLSPVNEPQWAWGSNNSASQEGTQATNTEIAALSKLLSQKFAAQSSPVKIVVGEAGQWEFLYTRNTDGRGEQIAQFFWPASSNYIGDQPNVARTISGHSYWTTCPDNTLVSTRQQLVSKINQVDPSLELWQTEFGILGDICGQYNGSPRNIGIDYGLYVAKVIHNDLAVANISSWQWWLSVSPYNYSDALVYINDPSGAINVDNCKNDGIVLESKQLWALGSYSHFIRPGMKRVTASVSGISDAVVAANSMMVSAYKDETKKKLVMVIVNMGTTVSTLQMGSENGLKLVGDKVAVYTTNATSNMKKSSAKANAIVITPRSITTLVGTYQ